MKTKFLDLIEDDVLFYVVSINIFSYLMCVTVKPIFSTRSAQACACNIRLSGIKNQADMRYSVSGQKSIRPNPKK
jgi:hypothetical protein